MKQRIISVLLIFLIAFGVFVYVWDIWSLTTNNGTAPLQADAIVQYLFWGAGPSTMFFAALAVPLLLLAILNDTRKLTVGTRERFPVLSIIAVYLAVIGVARPLIGLVVIIQHL